MKEEQKNRTVGDERTEEKSAESLYLDGETVLREFFRLKPVELRLLSELMKDSRRSDRELARTLGISQPTVTRTRARLENEKVVKEYTMIPDFRKLGFEILAITFLAVDKEPDSKEFERALSTFENILMFERGLGLKYSHVVVSLHEDYSSYVEFERKLNSLIARNSASFLVSLNDTYGFFSFSVLAKELETQTRLMQQKP